MSNNKTIRLRDSLKPNDSIEQYKPGLWARTEVLCSNGEVIINPNGKSYFEPGCPFTRSTNMVVIGGAQYVMEKTFGIAGEDIRIPTLYEESGGTIGLPDSIPASEPALGTFKTPDGNREPVYRQGNIVQLMGVGITGTAENDISVYPVEYREKSINISRVNTDGITVTGTMLPFRYTEDLLSPTDRRKYFGKSVNEDGITSYYLKRFESLPTIKHVWKTGEDIEDETRITERDDIWQNTAGINAVESFTEMVLKITRKDMKEWFIDKEQEDRTRINTIALYSGEYVKDENDPSDPGDYRDVRLFSKLCIPTEYLTLSKDIQILYRIYTQ